MPLAPRPRAKIIPEERGDTNLGTGRGKGSGKVRKCLGTRAEICGRGAETAEKFGFGDDLRALGA